MCQCENPKIEEFRIAVRNSVINVTNNFYVLFKRLNVAHKTKATNLNIFTSNLFFGSFTISNYPMDFLSSFYNNGYIIRRAGFLRRIDAEGNSNNNVNENNGNVDENDEDLHKAAVFLHLLFSPAER